MSAAGRKYEHPEPREVRHMEPSARSLGMAMWWAALIVVAAVVGVSWGWIADGGLVRLAEQIGEWR